MTKLDVIAQAPSRALETPATLDATAQFLSFEVGMYAVELFSGNQVRTSAGLPLPCARLDCLASGLVLKGRAVVSTTREGGWLSHGDMPALIRVVEGSAAVVLTIYKSAGTESPELRIRFIRDDVLRTASDPLEGADPGQTSPSEAALPFRLLVHAQERGDIRVGVAEWGGVPGSGLLLEGFAIETAAEAGLEPGELEYQAVLGEGWNTPWFTAGEFCGSRGLALPILGLRVRLTASAAEKYDCTIWGNFVGVGEVGPIASGDACEADGKPMDALRVAITPKGALPEQARAPSIQRARRRKLRHE